MKAKIFSFLILWIITFHLNAQTFYYYKGQQVSLVVDENAVNVITDNSAISSTTLRSLKVKYSDSGFQL